MIKIKRIYEPTSKEDGIRILVDRLWPCGITKEKARLDLWLKDVGPSDGLRKWYGHDPEKWPEFRRRYFRELEEKKELLGTIRAEAKKRKVTLLFGAKEEKFNQAEAIREYLKQHR